MDCGMFFCYIGSLISGMVSGCLINNFILEFNDLVYWGLWWEVLDWFYKINNFFEFIGWVCFVFCEGFCVLGINNFLVIIKNIEYFIIEKGWQEGWVMLELFVKCMGKKVVVVGFGFVGLVVVVQLNKVGYWVMVYEWEDCFGGLFMYGIFNMKLDKEEVVLCCLNVLEVEGVIFVCNMEIGKDLFLEILFKDYDVVVFCIGVIKFRDLAIVGWELEGIYFVMEFLIVNIKVILDKIFGLNFISVKDKDVVIIGGGDIGIDCVGIFFCYGCRSLV